MNDDRIEKLIKQISENIRATVDQRMYDALCGSAATYGTAGVTANTTSFDQGEPLTLAKLEKVMAEARLKMPPIETWLESRWFPNDKALRVEAAGENFTCAGQLFWTQLELRIKRLPLGKKPLDANPFGMRVTPTNIDPFEGEDDCRSKRNREIWQRLERAIEICLVEIPDWLRAKRASK